jgi:hypothetical protein
MKLERTLRYLAEYEAAHPHAERLKELIRARFPEAQFDRLARRVDGPGFVLSAYTRDRYGWEVLDLVSQRLREIFEQHQVAIAVVPLHISEYIDEDILY